MSEQRQETAAGVRIVHRADGTAEVNGVTVQAEAEQDLRDAAYLAAVRLVAGASAPVAATRVEADGTEYPLMLYPGRNVFSADAAGGGAPGDGTRGRLREIVRGRVTLGGNSSRASRVSLANRASRVSRLRMRHLLHARLLAGAVAGCVLAAVLATVLLGNNDPALVRLTVDQENEALHMPFAQAAGRGMAEAAWRGVLAASGTAAPSASPRAQEQHPGAAVAGTAGAAQGAGVSHRSKSVRTAPGPRPAPRPAPAKPLVVTAVTLTLVGGAKGDPNVAYVIMVSATGPQPLTLTYGYVGSKHGAPVTKSVVLSGQTEYAIADEFAAQPYCGGTVTMHAGTSPAAGNGTVTATAASGC